MKREGRVKEGGAFTISGLCMGGQLSRDSGGCRHQLGKGQGQMAAGWREYSGCLCSSVCCDSELQISIARSTVVHHSLMTVLRFRRSM